MPQKAIHFSFCCSIVKRTIMKAVDFEEVKKGDTILVYDKSYSSPFIKIVVDSVEEDEHSIICADTGLDVYPDENDQYILIDYEDE